jgi:hypothetical protein
MEVLCAEENPFVGIDEVVFNRVVKALGEEFDLHTFEREYLEISSASQSPNSSESSDPKEEYIPDLVLEE